MAEKSEQLDPRFKDAPVAGNATKLSDNGIASVKDIGNDLVEVTDRDGRVSVFPKDAEPLNMSAKQRQAAQDAAIEASPVDPELSPGHSKFDPEKSSVEVPEKVEGEKVVNQNLNVDKKSK